MHRPTLLLLAFLVSAPGAALRAGDPSHWAYAAPARPDLPALDHGGAWARNAVDAFVLARLDDAGLAPAVEADRERLLRRVFLDLVGLPPSIEAIDAFLADDRPDAFERVVDELLASPAFGERWARPWLDAARYADSNGFQRDGHRQLWAFRDWVIDALNADMPFDHFTVEQIAGDLLPDAGNAQRIATGFHRATTVNVEAGVDQEQDRVNAVLDRVNTTGTVWLGTTLECAQCHDHKYDPFTQREYYQLFAFFNNTPLETSGHDGARREFTGPRITLPQTAEERAMRDRLREEKKALEKRIGELEKQQAAGDDLESTRGELEELEKRLAQTRPDSSLVMVELDDPRPTNVFTRGSFLTPGEPVDAATPAALHPLPGDAPRNRLGLARWLVDPANPLMARVTVNRWWGELFGRGLVPSLEDFGTRAPRPSHPMLLDWLATELVRDRWSRKRAIRRLVTSATYRQSSRVSPEKLQRDPENRLLSRGARFRLDAERIRDNALAISGQLCRTMGGPPVRPPQPPDVWRVTGVVDNTYRASEGEDRDRRGVYVVWRRSSPYPSFVNFDAPDRTACVVERPRTNTPLQALTLLNDPVYVEAASAFAKRVLSETRGAPLDVRLTLAFRLAVTRRPTASELALLGRALEREIERAREDPKRVRATLGDRRAPEGVTREELVAWIHIATVLLNLDETITRG